MKFFVSVFLIALLSLTACFFLPWWMIAVVGFLVAALIPQSPGRSFLAGFVALFFLWLCLSLYISSANGHVLAHKMSMLILKGDNLVLLFLATALIGGLLAGMGSLTGSFVRGRSRA
ncbi:MAG: hypothetical protein EOO06_01475 [Chitinophagaceae bacterium]|nr:MAG: hypothetical protein EOO06_01475 [Chitinophagaceae bacterium]